MRRVVIVTYPGVQTLDVIGPAEVFSTAAAIAGDGLRASRWWRPRPGRSPTSSVSICADRALADCRGPIDTLIVAGGTGSRAAQDDDAPDRVAARVPPRRSRRVTSVCTGALLLARGRACSTGAAPPPTGPGATTWPRRYPAVSVEPEPIFVRDGNVSTSAGVTAGMDLALALVEEDLGAEVALEVARWLVLFLRRPGGQSQFSAQLAAQTARARAAARAAGAGSPSTSARTCRCRRWPRRACMSERNFARAFRREIGMTPAAYVEAARVERARIALESGDLAVDAVARAGRASAPSRRMRRAFRRRVGREPGRLPQPLPPAGGGLTPEEPR